MKETRAFDESLLGGEESAPGRPALARTSHEQIALWYKEHANPLYHYLVATHGDEQRAEDAVSDTFLKLHEQLLRGKAIRNPRAWVFTAARNLLNTAWKCAEREDKLHRAFAWLKSTPVQDPEEALCDRRRQEALDRAWAALPEIERTCLDLRASGLKLAEVGKRVELDAQRVAKVIARAVRRLKKNVEGEVDG